MKSFSVALRRAVGAVLLLALAGPVAAQSVYPNKAIRFITPYAPGGSTTAVARLVGQKLTESWGQPVIVDNRPGGNTIIGTGSGSRGQLRFSYRPAFLAVSPA